jgi:hypothetical protein
MRAKLDSAQRSRTTEPVLGQVKAVQGGARFMRRGLRACQAEWKLLVAPRTCSSSGAGPPLPPADQEGPGRRHRSAPMPSN